MTAPARRLHLVEPAGDRLRRLFEHEDALLAELAQVRAWQIDARDEYAAEEGLLIRPGLRALREILA